MTAFRKDVDQKIRAWAAETKDDGETGRVERKRKLDDIEDKAEELLNFSKKIKGK